jgi:hypothetical protein
MKMAPRSEKDVIGRHGTVYSHDVIGPEANKKHEVVEQELRESALAIVREAAGDDVESHGLIALSDMELTLGNAIRIHEQISKFVEISLEDITAEYLAKVTDRVIKDKSGELTDEDFAEYFTGLSQFLPELSKAA